jgi:hypothetical protein
MSVYRINHNFVEDGRHALRGRLRVQYAVLITILCAGVMAAIWHRMGPREEFHFATYAIGISALIAIVVISMRDTWRRGLNHLQETVETYRLTVEPGKILCVRSHAKPVVLEPRDIIKVQEDSKHGLHLCTKDPKLCIVIPAQLENIEACKAELRAQGLSWKSE